jgi:hypothetical protein
VRGNTDIADAIAGDALCHGILSVVGTGGPGWGVENARGNITFKGLGRPELTRRRRAPFREATRAEPRSVDSPARGARGDCVGRLGERRIHA